MEVLVDRPTRHRRAEIARHGEPMVAVEVVALETRPPARFVDEGRMGRRDLVLPENGGRMAGDTQSAALADPSAGVLHVASTTLMGADRSPGGRKPCLLESVDRVEVIGRVVARNTGTVRHRLMAENDTISAEAQVVPGEGLELLAQRPRGFGVARSAVEVFMAGRLGARGEPSAAVCTREEQHRAERSSNGDDVREESRLGHHGANPLCVTMM